MRMRPTRSLRPVAGVEHAAAALELARVDADVGELADERVGHDLEGQGREGLVVVGESVGRAVLVALDDLEALHRRDVERARQEVDDGVEQRLHALVLERGAAQQRGDRDVERGLADRRTQPVDVDVLLGQVGLHERVVVLRDGLEQAHARGVGGLGHLGGDLVDRPLATEVVVVHDRLHVDQVDDAAEVRLGADRKLDRDRVRAEAIDDRLDAHVEVRAGAVHLVDVGDARDAVLVGLAPDRLGLGLDAGDGVEDRDRAVEHAQRALDLDGEVDVAGRVDDVHAVVAPRGGGGSGGDRDATLLLLLHPVHGRRALVDLAELVRAARIEEDALGRRRLAGVDVRHDPDVARLL